MILLPEFSDLAHELACLDPLEHGEVALHPRVARDGAHRLVHPVHDLKKQELHL